MREKDRDREMQPQSHPLKKATAAKKKEKVPAEPSLEDD